MLDNDLPRVKMTEEGRQNLSRFVVSFVFVGVASLIPEESVWQPLKIWLICVSFMLAFIVLGRMLISAIDTIGK